MMMQKVRTNNKCAVNEDLFFSNVEFVKTLQIPARLPTLFQKVSSVVAAGHDQVQLDPFRKLLKTELLSTKDCSSYKCPTKNCKTRNTFHTSYIEKNLAGCSNCDKIETIVKRILDSKGYQFVKLFKQGTVLYVQFICDKEHSQNMPYYAFRKGRECVECNKVPIKKKDAEKLEPKNCDCKKYGKNGKEIKNAVCEHYNFAAYFPEETLEWDYCLNDILPTKVAPGSREKRWFQCEHCAEFYHQMLYSRRSNKRCPYCFAHKLSKKNNLLALRPDLAEEWDHDNNFKYCNEVSPKSQEKAWWICKDIPGEIHRYLQKINTHCDDAKQGGCYCKNKNYKQKDIFLHNIKQPI